VKLGLGLGELCEIVGFYSRKVGREEAQRAQESEDGGRSIGPRNTRNTRKDLNRRERRERRADSGRQTAESDFVTELTERGHRGGRRRTEDGRREDGRRRVE
jgi:hypothetical protein